MRFHLLFLRLLFLPGAFLSFAAYASGFDCIELALSAPQSQKEIVEKQCATLKSLYAYEEAACGLNVKTQLSLTQNDILSLGYHINYQCPEDVIPTEKSFIYNWLKDGRSIPVKAVWFSLTDEERLGILSDVQNDQDPDGRCHGPQFPTKMEISEDVILFSGFYPELENPIQNKACDVKVLRPPSFLEAYFEVDGHAACKLPSDLAVRASQLLTLAPEFLKDPQDKKIAAQMEEIFPKNYRELVFMAGSWWYPGWEPLFDNQDFSFSRLKISESQSFEACQGPLFALGSNDLLEIWHKLYQHMDAEEWITANLRMQAGLWQADAINAFANFYPESLQESWDEKAEVKAWMNLTVEEMAGLIAWVNSMPDAQCHDDTEACDYSLVMPFIPIDTLPLDEDEKQRLNQKIQEAKAVFLK